MNVKYVDLKHTLNATETFFALRSQAHSDITGLFVL